MAGFSGTGKSNITLMLALMAFARGDAVVYVPSCDTWKEQVEESTRANYWLDCTRVTLAKHFERQAKFHSGYTWGDLLFCEDPVKAYAAVMKELHEYDGGEFAVLIFYDEQSKAFGEDSIILKEATTFEVCLAVARFLVCYLFMLFSPLSADQERLPHHLDNGAEPVVVGSARGVGASRDAA